MSLITKKRLTIGFMAENSNYRSESLITKGIRRAAAEADVNFIHFGYLGTNDLHDESRFESEQQSILRLHKKHNELKQYIETFGLDGLLVIGWAKDFQGDNLAYFMQQVGDLPVFSMGDKLADYPYTKMHGYPYIRELTSHFIIDHNRMRIAYVQAWNGKDDREEGYADAMAEAGINTEGLVVFQSELAQCQHTHERTERALQILLNERPTRPEAIIFTSATEGKLAIEYLADCGLRVPDDIAIACFEDDESLQFMHPSITSISYPYEEIGSASARKLIRMLHNEQVDQMNEAKSHVNYRQSCGCGLRIESANYSEVFHQFVAERELNATLAYMGRSLLSLFNMTDILDLFNDFLGWLKTPSCYLFQYRDGDKLQMLFGSNDYKWVHQDMNADISLSEAYAHFKENKQGSFNIIVSPLRIRKEQIGFMWVEPGDKSAMAIFTLFGFLKVAMKGSALFDESSMLVRQLTEEVRLRQERETQLAILADTDGLTGLFNRRFFYNTIHAATTAETSKPFSLLFIDIDGFKDVNDQYGHDTGDLLVANITERISKALATETYPINDPLKRYQNKPAIFRFGGDEFIAMVMECDIDKLADRAQTLIAIIGAPYVLSGWTVNITCSIGISRYPHDSQVDSELIKQSDLAMYQAKTIRNSYTFYHDLL